MTGINNYLSQYQLASEAAKLAALNAYHMTGMSIELPGGMLTATMEKVGLNLSMALTQLRNEHEDELYRLSQAGERQTDTSNFNNPYRSIVIEYNKLVS